MDMITALGLAAAFFTTVSYFPQLLKVWRTRKTEDLSLKMLASLFTGLSLWIAYGVVKQDIAIIIANVVSVAFVGFIASFKLRAVFR
jgi:MtN3 and saliva related transmembrane protein